jgi:hypothetical protein
MDGKAGLGLLLSRIMGFEHCKIATPSKDFLTHLHTFPKVSLLKLIQYFGG